MPRPERKYDSKRGKHYYIRKGKKHYIKIPAGITIKQFHHANIKFINYDEKGARRVKRKEKKPVVNFSRQFLSSGMNTVHNPININFPPTYTYTPEKKYIPYVGKDDKENLSKEIRKILTSNAGTQSETIQPAIPIVQGIPVATQIANPVATLIANPMAIPVVFKTPVQKPLSPMQISPFITPKISVTAPNTITPLKIIPELDTTSDTTVKYVPNIKKNGKEDTLSQATTIKYEPKKKRSVPPIIFGDEPKFDTSSLSTIKYEGTQKKPINFGNDLIKTGFDRLQETIERDKEKIRNASVIEINESKSDHTLKESKESESDNISDLDDNVNDADDLNSLKFKDLMKNADFVNIDEPIVVDLEPMEKEEKSKKREKPTDTESVQETTAPRKKAKPSEDTRKRAEKRYRDEEVPTEEETRTEATVDRAIRHSPRNEAKKQKLYDERDREQAERIAKLKQKRKIERNKKLEQIQKRKEEKLSKDVRKKLKESEPESKNEETAIVPRNMETAIVEADEPISGSGIDDGLYDDEISKILAKTVKGHFVPVIAQDEIKSLPNYVKKNKKVFGAVINTNPKVSTGLGNDGYPTGHWTSILIDARDDFPSIEFFDPLVKTKPSQELIDTAKKIAIQMNPEKMFKFKHNSIKRQSSLSSSCGIHSAKFIEDRIRGRSWADASGYNHWHKTHTSNSGDDSKDGENKIDAVKKEYRNYI